VASEAQIPVQTEVEGEARDPGVPRYQPRVVMVESTADGPTAMQRAVWQAEYNAARGALSRVIVPGWRQSDGSLGGSTYWSHSASRSCRLTWNC
jgi:prophage tail gpP-like protein